METLLTLLSLVLPSLTDEVAGTVGRVSGHVAPDTLTGGAGGELQAPQSVVP